MDVHSETTEPSRRAAVGVAPPPDFGDWARPSLLAMTRVARRLAPQADAEDVVQDALAQAWRKWHQFDATRGSATTWLLAITADQARAQRRRGLRRRAVFDDDAAVPDPPVEGPDRAAALDVRQALTTLTVRQRIAVELHYFVGLDVADTAAVMGCSAGTVKSTLFDARRRMSTLLEEKA